jgi:hypothetical protein
MTLRAFENGYWYLDDLKDFARQIGIPEAGRLERTSALNLPTKRALRKTGAKDLERGLSLNLRIEHYTSNHETKEFIVREARKSDPELREKSGVWYRLNRWREDQITSGNRPTYGDLVQQYVALNKWSDSIRCHTVDTSTSSSRSPQRRRTGRAQMRLPSGKNSRLWMSPRTMPRG